MKQVEFILYVSDQKRSRDFYKELLMLEPSLDVEGMTEFNLTENAKLGLMPEDGIAKIISHKTKHPELGRGIPRCELYLKVDDANKYFLRSIDLGADLISKPEKRDWGDTVAYVSDPDGHIIAFASNDSKVSDQSDQ